MTFFLKFQKKFDLNYNIMAKDYDKARKEFSVYFECHAIYNNARVPFNMQGSFFFGKMVLLSFACELGLKTLILKDGGKPKKGHNLNDLVACVDARIKHVIFDTMEMNELSFDECISKNSDSFVKWRYFTESIPLRADIQFLERFLLVLAMLVLGEEYISNLLKSLILIPSAHPNHPHNPT